MATYRVETLDPDRLKQTALALYAKAAADFHPQIVIGVRTGGYHIAELMQAGFEPGVRLLDVTCRRPGTHKKSQSSLFQRTLKLLPRFINDRLRIVEHRMLLQRHATVQQSERTIPDSELAAIAVALDGLDAARILVVDDAVDSGSTLLTVTKKIGAIASAHATIRTAAVTLTTRTSLIEPDYVIYRDVLCRFPWSFDFR
jgi:hypoxanthine phosphoribosyltransferase